MMGQLREPHPRFTIVRLSGSNSVVECDLANSPISNTFNNLTGLRGLPSA